MAKERSRVQRPVYVDELACVVLKKAFDRITQEIEDSGQKLTWRLRRQRVLAEAKAQRARR
jgi:hypothetical protein